MPAVPAGAAATGATATGARVGSGGGSGVAVGGGAAVSVGAVVAVAGTAVGAGAVAEGTAVAVAAGVGAGGAAQALNKAIDKLRARHRRSRRMDTLLGRDHARSWAGFRAHRSRPFRIGSSPDAVGATEARRSRGKIKSDNATRPSSANTSIEHVSTKIRRSSVCCDNVKGATCTAAKFSETPLFPERRRSRLSVRAAPSTMTSVNASAPC